MRDLVFLRMVTLDRFEAEGSRVVWLETGRGKGDKDSTFLGKWLIVSKDRPKMVMLSAFSLRIGSRTVQSPLVEFSITSVTFLGIEIEHLLINRLLSFEETFSGPNKKEGETSDGTKTMGGFGCVSPGLSWTNYADLKT